MTYFVVRITEVLAFSHAAGGAAAGALSYGYLICEYVILYIYYFLNNV